MDRTVPVTITGVASALGMTGFTVNGRVHPRGQYTHCWFEYGTDSTFGQRTKPEPLPARRAAYYAESWDEGCNGWKGDFGCQEEHRTDGGPSEGYLRVTEQPVLSDFNHDASGVLHLMTGLHTGPINKDEAVDLGGGDGDLRNARVSLYLRGHDWQPNGSEFGFWLQCQSNIELGHDPGWRRANYSYCSHPLTEYLLDGEWHRVELDLINDSTLWTYGGNNSIQQGPNAVRYAYWPIDQCLSHANVNLLFLSTFVNPENPPTGSVDFDELEIAYCNRSLVYPGNGGERISWPDSPEDTSALTDGWRAGEGRTWRSAADPVDAQEFVYRFDNDVVLDTVQLHQHPEWPAKDVDVLVSDDGERFRKVLELTLDEYDSENPGTTFGLARGLEAQGCFVKIRILSGYRDRHWGLGEIEIFGSGVDLPHDEVEQHVSTDIVDLTPGKTYHYRVVAESDAGRSYGEGRIFTTPDSQKPLATSGAVTRSSDGNYGETERSHERHGLCQLLLFRVRKDSLRGHTLRERHGYSGRVEAAFDVFTTGRADALAGNFRRVATNDANRCGQLAGSGARQHLSLPAGCR